MATLRIDQNTLQVSGTDNPLIFNLACEITEDGDDIPDYQKEFTPIRILYNRNMTKSDAVRVALVEYQRVKSIPKAADVRAAIIASLGTSIKPFDRSPPAPPAPPEEPPEEP